MAEADPQTAEDTSQLDDLLEILRNGDSVGGKARQRGRAGKSRRQEPPALDTSLPFDPSADPGDKAQTMLAALKGLDGFVPASPTAGSYARRTRRRPGTGTHTPALSPTTEDYPLPHDLSSFNDSTTLVNDSEISIPPTDDDPLTDDAEAAFHADPDETVRMI